MVGLYGPEVGVYALIYLFLGLVYFLIHKRLVEISKNIKKDNSANFHFLLWDFIFYALMGILVTFAVRVAGILLVFGFCYRYPFGQDVFTTPDNRLDYRNSCQHHRRLSILYSRFFNRRYGCCNPGNHIIIGLNFKKYTTKGARLVPFIFLEELIVNDRN